MVTVHSFLRYHVDDWGTNPATASLDLPAKLGGTCTVYPSYKYCD